MPKGLAVLLRAAIVRAPATIRSKTLAVNHGLTPPMRLMLFVAPALIIIIAAIELAWMTGGNTGPNLRRNCRAPFSVPRSSVGRIASAPRGLNASGGHREGEAESSSAFTGPFDLGVQLARKSGDQLSAGASLPLLGQSLAIVPQGKPSLVGADPL